MISKEIDAAINKQINEELSSSYIYLSMSAYLADQGLDGFASWMRTQVQEEMFHATKFINYLEERGGRVIYDSIPKPQTEWNDIVDVFEGTLAHEKHITGCINNLMDLAIEKRDHATISFLQWFIDEQVEEEATAEDMLNKLKLTGGKGNALFFMNQEAGKRVFTPPAE